MTTDSAIGRAIPVLETKLFRRPTRSMITMATTVESTLISTVSMLIAKEQSVVCLDT